MGRSRRGGARLAAGRPKPKRKRCPTRCARARLGARIYYRLRPSTCSTAPAQPEGSVQQAS
eukprot:4244538-Pleurochrysis_carterae.AAC.1